MSTATVAPAGADAATDSSAPFADPNARVEQRIAAEARLSDLEHDVQDLAHRFFAPTKSPPPLPRRSRRCAWLPSN